jgi:hypothetical protein
MEITINFNQLALKRWYGRIDGDDCLLIAFISNLKSENPAIKKHMINGFFRLNRAFISQQLPVLQFSEDWISRRLKRLQDCGLVDLEHFRDSGGRPLLYGRMSKLYWRDLESANAYSDKLKLPPDNAHRDDCPTGTRDHCPTYDCPTDQCKINEEGTPPPPLDGADGAPQEEESPAPDHVMTEAEFALLRRAVPWARVEECQEEGR